MSLIVTVKNYRKLRPHRQTSDKQVFNPLRLSRLLVALLALAISSFFSHTAKADNPPSHLSKASTHNSTSSATQARPVWDGKTLLFHNSEGTLALTVISDDVIRVHFTKADSFVRNDTYAVIGQPSSEADPKVEIGHDLTTLETSKLKVSIRQNPLRISFADDAGNTLDQDDAERGMTFDDSGFSVSKRLGEDEHVYGFGEKNGRLDKRGWNLGGYNYVMWNTDTYMHDSATDPMYVSVPFFMVMNQGKAHGIFLDNTWRSFFDVGHDHPGLLTFGAAGGDMDYYFINGPDPKDVIERYTALTGRMPLPPLWSLGYNQCRYSYYPESRVRQLADTFRQKEIPADVIWLDIDYQDNYKPFTWDYERFPDPKKMLSDLRAEHFHVVCIVDPHPKKEKGYPPYDEGRKNNYFVKNPDGSVYQGPVWPSHAKQSPGPSVFPDFSNPAARQWWGQLYRGLEDDGIAGIWNDMDEPSVFDTPSGTMPLNVVFNNDGHLATGYEMHNIYGQQMSRATFEGLSELRPNERAFVLTRSSFAGGQRYAALWTGDSTSDWSSLRQSIATLLGLGLSGFPFVGSDIGGFVGSPSGELYTRWLQVGLFCPFMRSHSDSSSPSKEPWVFGDSNEAINKSTIELRYQLLPYIYNVMAQASETGVPALRPLFLEFPRDEHAATIDDEFLFGPDLLVAPVLYEGVTQRSVYLPEGDWYNYWTGESLKGGQTIQMPVTLKSIPMFVRAGGFIFNQPVVQSTDQMPGNALKVLIAPAKNSASWLYEDDGETLDYRNGNFMKRQFSQAYDKKQAIIKVSAPDGSYRPAQRELVLELWTDHEPKNVSLETEGQASKKMELPRLAGNDVADNSSGWSFDNGVLTIKTQDTFAPMEFVVDGISRP
ncbi:MAG TPA: glycoside hydrolase family 31 protein [Pseudomonadales bacterium]|nr:glycoside hydrolase family 31 protein [Pseudomonadales bacterium]